MRLAQSRVIAVCAGSVHYTVPPLVPSAAPCRPLGFPNGQIQCQSQSDCSLVHVECRRTASPIRRRCLAPMGVRSCILQHITLYWSFKACSDCRESPSGLNTAIRSGGSRPPQGDWKLLRPDESGSPQGSTWYLATAPGRRTEDSCRHDVPGNGRSSREWVLFDIDHGTSRYKASGKPAGMSLDNEQRDVLLDR